MGRVVLEGQPVVSLAARAVPLAESLARRAAALGQRAARAEYPELRVTIGTVERTFSTYTVFVSVVIVAVAAD